MIYLDTNVLLSLFLRDSATERAEHWFAQQVLPCVASDWVKAEFFGAVGLRRRKGELSLSQAKVANATLGARLQAHLLILPASNDAMALAASWLCHPDCSLQTGDALHLAIAYVGGASMLATLDGRFAKAARRLKLSTLSIALVPDAPYRVEQVRQPYVLGSDGAIAVPNFTTKRRRAVVSKAVPKISLKTAVKRVARDKSKSP